MSLGITVAKRTRAAFLAADIADVIFATHSGSNLQDDDEPCIVAHTRRLLECPDCVATCKMVRSLWLGHGDGGDLIALDHYEH
ncbi:hypothetical protein CCB80_08710 [Armatimonadetes bacterium Uphvl-Ar1]|nr:hypothetical protein CCB80_08710 [Armatimonadetes bacterium Uphvl-Ar1]